MAKQKAGAGSQALTKYDEQLAALAKQATEVEASVGSAGNFLSIRGGVLSYQGAQAKDNKMSVIILHAILENQWYDKRFDPNNPSSPACYAFGESQADMVPHEQASKPQNENCADCPKMKFGSADTGKGKACKACQRIALIPENALDDLDANAEIAYLKLPFFSTVEYAAYVRQLADIYKRPPLAFITEITVVPDPKSQFRVKFHMTDKVEDPEAIRLLLELRQKASAEIGFPYPEIEDEAPAARQRSATPRKAATRKPATASPVQQPVAAATAVGAPVKVGLRRGVKPKY